MRGVVMRAYAVRVASLAEAWIEIGPTIQYHTGTYGRLPRGGVD